MNEIPTAEVINKERKIFEKQNNTKVFEPIEIVTKRRGKENLML